MRQTPFALGGQAVAALALLTIVHDDAGWPVLSIWLGVWATAVGLSLALLGAWRRAPDAMPVPLWEVRLIQTALLRGAAWALAVAILFPPGYADRLYFVGVLIALVSASPNSLAGQNRALTGYICVVLVPMGVRFFIDDEVSVTLVAMGLAMLVFAALFIAIGRRLGAGMAEAIRLRFANEALARELTRQNQRVAAALAQATEANAQKTRFLAAASHDLRQPVHAIGLLMGALRAETLPPRASAVLDRLYGSVRGLDQLFDSLLDITRLDAGRVVPAPAAVSVEELFAPLILRHDALAAGRGLKFRSRVLAASILVDRALIETMLSNLLSNALRFTDRGGVLLAARRVRAHGSEPGHIALEVWDSGCGIPEDRQEDIFGEFVQLSNPQRDRAHGLGLGLSICRRLARLTGCSLTVKSRLGRGSCFRLEVPAAPSSAAPQRWSALGDCGSRSISGLSVLIVDNDAEVRHATAALLVALGAWVEAVPDGAAAVAAIDSAERFPDIVIADWRLAGDEDGLKVIASVRSRVPQPLAAILVTGDVDSPGAAAAGIQVLTKPLAAERLATVLADLMRAPSATTSMPPD